MPAALLRDALAVYAQNRLGERHQGYKVVVKFDVFNILHTIVPFSAQRN